MRAVVVTGVSSGIGFQIAKYLMQQGIKVFGSVRKIEDGQALQEEFGELFTPLLFDVTDEAAVGQAAQMVKKALACHTLWGLINNAGIVIPNTMLEIPIKDFRHQLEVNLTGQLIVSQAFIPLLGVDESLSGQPGKVINMGSVTGKLASPFIGPYVISKHGFEGFSDTLRIELMPYDIDVILIGPGMVSTPIWNKSSERVSEETIEQSRYQEAIKKFKSFVFNEVPKKSISPDVIAELVYSILTSDKPKARYAVVKNRLTDWLIPLCLPKRFLSKQIARMLGLQKR